MYKYDKIIVAPMAILRISDEIMADLKEYNAKKYKGDVYGKITETAEAAIKDYIK